MPKVRIVGEHAVDLSALGAIVRRAGTVWEIVLEEEEDVAMHED